MDAPPASPLQTIALVDDDRNILTSVSIGLQAEGFAIRVYSDGETALKALEAELTKAGLVDVTDANLSAVLSSIAATPDNGQGADTLSELNNLVKDVNWAAATAPTTIAEATDGISANELADGIQATMTVPAGATAPAAPTGPIIIDLGGGISIAVAGLVTPSIAAPTVPE